MSASFMSVLAGMACGDDPVSPGPTSAYGGVWAGSVVDASTGSGSFSMTLDGDAAPSGTWSATVAGRFLGGTLTGDPLNQAMQSFAASCASGGSLLITTTASGNSLSGTYRSFGCNGVVSGTLNLTRR